MEVAEESEVLVGVENHQDLCPQELVWLCEQVGSPMLGATMDCANALAVGETPEQFARTVLPHLKHIHLKDYRIYPTASGFRFVRCTLGTGVVDWLRLLRLFDEAPGELQGCIELGASTARHIRILEPEYWETFRLGNRFPSAPSIPSSMPFAGCMERRGRRMKSGARPTNAGNRRRPARTSSCSSSPPRLSISRKQGR